MHLRENSGICFCKVCPNSHAFKAGILTRNAKRQTNIGICATRLKPNQGKLKWTKMHLRDNSRICFCEVCRNPYTFQAKIFAKSANHQTYIGICPSRRQQNLAQTETSRNVFTRSFEICLRESMLKSPSFQHWNIRETRESPNIYRHLRITTPAFLKHLEKSKNAISEKSQICLGKF